MVDENVKNLGPLASLAGIWEGSVGKDVAPSPDLGVARTDYRERLVLEPIGRVDNHQQTLYGLRYSTVAWPLGESDPFHEEVGYWLWDAERKLAMRTFLVPRGVSVIAGATIEADAKAFSLQAELGSKTFGICSNPFLDAEFQTVRYEVSLRIDGPDRFSYEEDTQLRLTGQQDIFHHTDANTLERVG